MPNDIKIQSKKKPIESSKEASKSSEKAEVKKAKKPEVKAVEAIPAEEISKGEKKTQDIKEEILEKNQSEKIGAKEEPKKEISNFRVGDTVRILYRIIEGEKTRTQPFQGIVISKKGEGMSKTFTLRRIGANGIGVERIIPLYSPNIQKLKVVKKGKARRAKLYFLREKKGRAAMRVKERK